MNTDTIPSVDVIPSHMLDLSADPAGNVVAPEAFLFGYLFGGEDPNVCRCCCCTGECHSDGYDERDTHVDIGGAS